MTFLEKAAATALVGASVGLLAVGVTKTVKLIQAIQDTAPVLLIVSKGSPGHDDFAACYVGDHMATDTNVARRCAAAVWRTNMGRIRGTAASADHPSNATLECTKTSVMVSYLGMDIMASNIDGCAGHARNRIASVLKKNGREDQIESVLEAFDAALAAQKERFPSDDSVSVAAAA